ncbi:MAG: peptidylprolyl isomerase [Flavobacteriales bacterium]|nr:peptidylprolyl isomerase [Flavobacteriales bacterium]
MTIKKNSVVSIHYTLKTTDNKLIEESRNAHPLTYLQGAENIIEGLENELLGKEKGDKFSLVVQPEEAYGYSDPELVQEVSISMFEDPENVEVGIQIEIDSDEGLVYAMITKVENEVVTLDANHPLTDMTLMYDVEVVDVREATKEELAHGHAHGPGGFEHH